MATRTLKSDARQADERRRGPSLVRVLNASQPLVPAAAAGLADLDQLLIGRGEARGCERDSAGGVRRARWSEPDEWLSGDHFRVERAGDGWRLSDAGSKNGIRLNGIRLVEEELCDGDTIEAGRSWFLFCEQGLAEPWTDLTGREGPDATLCPELADTMDVLARVARARVAVLIHGEVGAGKEIAARFVHDRSGRGGRFVAVNCGAIPAGIIEAELFGAVKGAYSGASDSRKGLVRASDGGTLFLDEIAELPATAQTALLRVLQEREVTAVGSTTPHPVDLRVVAATHADLQAQCDAGDFRHDLYSRLQAHILHLPPLRERRHDLGSLIASLLRRFAPERAARITLADDAARALLACDWRYNVRELAQALETALAIASDCIELAHLPAAMRASAPAPATANATAEEAARLRALLEQHRGNVSAVARALNTSRSQVRRLAERHEIDLTTWR